MDWVYYYILVKVNIFIIFCFAFYLLQIFFTLLHWKRKTISKVNFDSFLKYELEMQLCIVLFVECHGLLYSFPVSFYSILEYGFEIIRKFCLTSQLVHFLHCELLPSSGCESWNREVKPSFGMTLELWTWAVVSWTDENCIIKSYLNFGEIATIKIAPNFDRLPIFF